MAVADRDRHLAPVGVLGRAAGMPFGIGHRRTRHARSKPSCETSRLAMTCVVSDGSCFAALIATGVDSARTGLIGTGGGAAAADAAGASGAAGAIASGGPTAAI
jgi:hypothetical protein